MATTDPLITPFEHGTRNIEVSDIPVPRGPKMSHTSSSGAQIARVRWAGGAAPRPRHGEHEQPSPRGQL